MSRFTVITIKSVPAVQMDSVARFLRENTVSPYYRRKQPLAEVRQRLTVPAVAFKIKTGREEKVVTFLIERGLGFERLWRVEHTPQDKY